MPQQDHCNKEDEIDDLDPHVKKFINGDGVHLMGNNSGSGHKTSDHDQHVGKFKEDH